jgi:hypothetical protein
MVGVGNHILKTSTNIFDNIHFLKHNNIIEDINKFNTVYNIKNISYKYICCD